MKWQDVTGAAVGLVGCALLVVTGTLSALAPMADPEGDPTLVVGGSPALPLPALKPGSTGSRCGTITYRGSAPADLSVYASAVAATRGMGADLLLRVEEDTGPPAAGCTGFRPSHLLFAGPLTAFPTSWGASAPVLLPAGGGQLVRYRLTYRLSPATPDSAQGGTAGLQLVWEVRRSSR